MGSDVFEDHGIVSEDWLSFVHHFLRAYIRLGFHRSQLYLKDFAIFLADQHLSPGKS